MEQQTEQTAIALGFFDGVHLGHQAVLLGAVELAAKQNLIPCAFTFTVRHHRPAAKALAGSILREREKREAMEALGIQIIYNPDFDEFKELTGEEFVRELLVERYHAGAICCGYDFRFGKNACCGVPELRTLCNRFEVQLAIIPAVLADGEPISSTRIRALLRQGDIPAVNRLLGRPYQFAFPVVPGQHLGRTINAPTINQPFPEGFALPRFGVYAAFALVEGVWHPAVTNIGTKPTVQSNNMPLAETYISGVQADLYGQEVPVRPVEFLRQEQKFSSVEELRENIARDIQSAMIRCAKAGEQH